jgi:GT2 family glycosyltransferase
MITRDRRDQALDTVRRLTDLPGSPAVIVVDNGSSDDTVTALQTQCPSAQVISLGANAGAAARTLGVRAARTPYVAFSDDDSWWAPDALTRAADHFDAAPRLAVLAARILVGPSQQLDPVCQEMANSPLPVAEDLPGPSLLGFVACGAVVRRSAYLQVGGFHPIVFFLGEETVLAQDLAAAGWGLAYLDDVVAHHHPQPGPTRVGRHRLELRNRLLSSWLRRPPSVALRDSGALLRQAHEPAARGAFLDAARRLPQVLRSRRVLPAEVEAAVRLLEATG